MHCKEQDGDCKSDFDDEQCNDNNDDEMERKWMEMNNEELIELLRNNKKDEHVRNC